MQAIKTSMISYTIVDASKHVVMTMQREEGTAPDGKPIDGHWVVRDLTGAWIDHDQYRFDLFDRLGITRT